MFSFCFLSVSTYSIEKPRIPSRPLTDWVELSVKSIHYDLNTSTFFLGSSDPFNVAFKVNSGTPYFNVEIKDNQVVVFSQSYSTYQVLIQNIPLQSGSTHSVKIKIEDASGQSKDSDFNMEIR